MKKILLMVMATTLAVAAVAQNPLMEPKWNTFQETPPFSKIKPEHFMPAVKAQIEEARAGINSITRGRTRPTFENTIEAIERNGEMLTRTLGVFYNLNSAETNDDLQKIAVELSPILTAYSNDIALNKQLFDRVKEVYDMRDKLNLTSEQARLLDHTYKSFARNGANLSDADKQKYRAITEELSGLSVKFDQNELAANNEFEMLLTNKEDLSGLPEALVEAAAADAKAKGKVGYLITLHYPSYVPFMKYAENRELREKIWKVRGSLCATGDKNDNRDVVKRTAELRLELANLLGYKTFADYALEERMAKSPAKVSALLNELYDKTIDYARKDVKLIEDFAHKNGFKGQLMGYDMSYWNEKYVTATFSVNDEMTRPYFKLEDAEQALFMLAGKLYGLKYVANKDIEVYHPDVKAYEVYDNDGKFLTTLFCDYFPRAGKNSGAWMNTFREGYVKEDGTEVRPIIVLVNNFTKPTETTPSLLTFAEFETMLHEFGHSLHGTFASGAYSSLTGTNVYRDFVELPSQIMENWAYEKLYLDLFAKHYQSGEKMPSELIDKLIASKNHLAAYDNVGQLRYGMNDMAWHSITEPISISVEQFEKNATAKTQILPVVEGMMMSPAFGHIFAGGYAAGYYSYKWAEVLEADAFSKFKKAGIFNNEVSHSFRDNILKKGDTEDPMVLYVRFAGSEPTTDPLIEKMGLK